MFKALLLEWLKSSLSQKKEPPYAKITAYLFTINGLTLLIAANYLYYYWIDNPYIMILMSAGTVLIMIATLITSVRCYLKYKSRHKALDAIKNTTGNLMTMVSENANGFRSFNKIASYLPLIIRIIPTSLLTLITYKIVKSTITSKLLKK